VHNDGDVRDDVACWAALVARLSALPAMLRLLGNIWGASVFAYAYLKTKSKAAILNPCKPMERGATMVV
jgi:hypothetical protein